MYTEEPRRSIDWGNILKKVLIIVFIAAIIFLIVWLLTRNTSNGVNVDYDGNNSNNTNITEPSGETYSKIFIDNYRYFHDTTKEYFLISNLPEKGETLKFTLQELIDKNLILPFSYTDNESCDTEASYVQVKNVDGKYTMTTTLVCGKEVATTKEELGCNQICEENIDCNTNCSEPVTDTDKDTNTDTEVEKVTEYQYKQAYNATETVYSCPSGYTKSGTKCVKTDTTTVKATKSVKYRCKDGYEMVGTGSSAKCVKDNETTVKATAKTTYSCPSGYVASGSGENTKCYKITGEKINANYYYDYSCASGTLRGDKCVKTTTTTVKATAKTTYSCSQGTLVNTKYCRIYSTTSRYETYKTYRGATYNGCSYSGSYTEACSTYSGCTRTYYKYYCSGSTYKDVAATAKTTYSCSKGTLSGSNCIVTKTTSTSADKDKIYYCSNSDYELSGKYCYKITKQTANPTKTTTYSCPEGYNKSGTGANTVCTSGGKDTISTYKNVNYTCNSGYTKVGTGSTAVCTKGSTSTIDATKSTKTVTKYRYKWSTETSLSGWTRTGETRTVTASSK